MQYAVGNPVADRDHGAPLGEARAEAAVLLEPLAQAVEPFGDRLAGSARERLRAGVDLDPGDDSPPGEEIGEPRPVRRRLAQRLVEEDDAADELLQVGRREEHVAVRAPVLLGRFEPDRVEALLDRAGALVGREDAAVVGDELPGGCVQVSSHLVVLSSVRGPCRKGGRRRSAARCRSGSASRSTPSRRRPR